jgi:hypothetical protein
MRTVESPDNREYEYKPRWSVILLGVLFFGVLAVVFAALAHWKRGIVRFGFTIIPPEAAEVFWWCFAAVSFGFIFYCVLLAILRLIRPQRIVFTPAAITLPKSRWSSAEIAVPYLAITDLSFSQANGQRLLRVTHAGGKITISSWFLPTDEQFEQVRHLLEELVKAQKAPA